MCFARLQEGLGIDIAVSRDNEPAVARVPASTPCNIEDLARAAEEHLRQRLKAARLTEETGSQETKRFRQRQGALDAVPTNVSLRCHLESIRRAGIARTPRLSRQLMPEQRAALARLTRGLVNKIFHTPFTGLEQAALRSDRSEFRGVARTIFQPEEEAGVRASQAVN